MLRRVVLHGVDLRMEKERQFSFPPVQNFVPGRSHKRRFLNSQYREMRARMMQRFK